MTIYQTKVVDFIGLDESLDRVVLTITDHLPWLPDNEHLLLLQEKINTHLAFIESGEIFDSYPKAKGKEIGIQVIFKHQPAGDAVYFLEKAKEIVQGAGIYFSSQVSTNED